MKKIHFGKNDKITTINNFYLIDQSTALHNSKNPSIFHTESKNSSIKFNLQGKEIEAEEGKKLVGDDYKTLKIHWNKIINK